MDLKSLQSNKIKTKKNKDDWHLGHRERVKNKFIQNFNSSHNCDELLELILFFTIPRKDVKPLAKKLLQEYNSLPELISLPIEDLEKITEISKNTALLFKIIKSISSHILKKDLYKKPIIQNWQQLLDYCYVDLALEKKEYLKLLYLNNKHYLIKDIMLQEGTINHAPIYPREIIKKALDIGATSFILIHNHPSGDQTPSDQDILITSKLATAAKLFDITLLDHLIISKNGITSFKNHGLIP